MSGASAIEWTDATWNPVRGCSRVSEGCRNCYAERVAARFSDEGTETNDVNGHMAGAQPFAGFARQTPAGPRWTGEVALMRHALDWPLRWRGDKRARAEGRPSRVFVNSMSDLFHERLSDEEIAAVFGVMAASPQHVFQVLTKRPERALRWFRTAPWGIDAPNGPADVCVIAAGLRMGRDEFLTPIVPWPLPNVWLGVSVEDQATADERIPLLLQCPAAVRFVSYEPALATVDFWSIPDDRTRVAEFSARNTPLGGLDWVIVGGESGPGARPLDLAWARSAVEQCRAAGVACFVKQLGARPMNTFEIREGETPREAIERSCSKVGWPPRDRKGGDWSEWPEDLRVREFPDVPLSARQGKGEGR